MRGFEGGLDEPEGRRRRELLTPGRQFRKSWHGRQDFELGCAPKHRSEAGEGIARARLAPNGVGFHGARIRGAEGVKAPAPEKGEKAVFRGPEEPLVSFPGTRLESDHHELREVPVDEGRKRHGLGLDLERAALGGQAHQPLRLGARGPLPLDGGVAAVTSHATLFVSVPI